MPPRPAPTYTPYLTSLIQSTTYDSLPSVEELESLNSILSAQSTAVAADIERRTRRLAKRKDRDMEREDEEAAALEANAASSLKLEAIERARLDNVAARKASPGGVKVKKERNSLSPAPSNASSASFRPQHGIPIQPITYGQSQMKKKKKRVLDSDDEGRSSARDRSTTLASPPPHQAGTSGLKLKLSGSQHPKSRPVDPSPTPSGSTAAVSAMAGTSIDFSLPPQPSKPLIPHRPGVQKPLKPGPKRQSEVDEDFSNVKVPSQTAFTTFWSSVEPYLREIREDDLAMLGFKADAPELYELPPRGRHYTEVWDEEDGLPPGSTPRFSVPNLRQTQGGPSRGTLPLPHFVPVTEMRDEALVDEHRGLGSLTERVVAAMVGDKDTAEAKKAEVSGRGIEEESSRDGMRVDVVDLEERMKRELRSVMLLGEHEDFDPKNRDDDEVTSALRQSQRLLLQQTQINDARKARLAEVARQRLAYAEYQTALEGIEKSIEAGWTRRVKKYGVTPKKAGQNQQAVARPPVPENLRRLVDVRKGWIENVGKIMREQPKGLVSGLPDRSIYDGIGEEIEERDEKMVEESVEVESGDEGDR